MLESLLARAGWSAGSVDLVALPGESPVLRDFSETFRCTRLPGARELNFQAELGACGASWAGAAILTSLAFVEGGAAKAVLMAAATGGAGWGLALEGIRAE